MKTDYASLLRIKALVYQASSDLGCKWLSKKKCVMVHFIFNLRIREHQSSPSKKVD